MFGINTSYVYRLSKRSISSVCNKPFGPAKVALLGITGGTVASLALLLKQCQGVSEIRLYGETDEVCGTAIDINYIDTNTKIVAYQGDNRFLKACVEDSNIVVICGSSPYTMGQTQEQQFRANVDQVRHYALHVAEYNPSAIVILATPPINSMVPLVCEEFKKAGVFDSRKIIGISNMASIRANSLIGKALKRDPTHYLCPVLGGMCPKTCVPILSQTTPTVELSKKERDALVKRISYAAIDACEKRCTENSGEYFMPAVFSVTRMVNSLIKALKGERSIMEVAYVRQTGHIDDFLPYLSTIVRLGPNGVEESYMPKITPDECALLKKAHPFLQKSIRMGQSVVTGEIFRQNLVPYIHEDTYKMEPVEVVGDVTVDLGKKYRNFNIYQ